MNPLVGCCGFPTARARYWKRFRAVEVQATFYQPPRPATLRRWRAEAPPGAVFAVKAWQLITHPASSPTYRRLRHPIAPDRRDRYGFFQATDEVWTAWERTREAAEALAARAILFQCPARFRPVPENLERMRAFFRRIDRGPFLLAWEPRGAWPPEQVRTLCRELDLVHAVDPLASDPVTPARLYWRLHGRGGYRHRYTDAELAELAGRCAGRDGFVFFNNLHMWDDAARFARRLAAGPADPA